MSRKKVKKEVVKRKTNIYDPMGVYGRGLTENQRLGMTRQMKIENIRNPDKVLTREDLEEYKKTLIYYGIPTVINYKIKTINITFPLQRTTTDVTNLKINTILQNQYGIHANAFYCDSFSIERDPNLYDLWFPVIQPFFAVGNAALTINGNNDGVAADISNHIVTIPSYWIDGDLINFYSLSYDTTKIFAGITQAYGTVFGDFELLPRDSSLIPYLMFPNDNFPVMHFGVNFIGAIMSGFQMIARIHVIY